MKRYELWIDNDDRLVVSEYDRLNSLNESNIFRGTETYNVIKVLSSKPILNIIEQEKEDKIILEFENYVVNLNEINRVVSKRGMTPLAQTIKKHFEKQTLKEIPKKKVKRKNKHTKAKIIAVGTILAIILAASAIISETKAYSESNISNLSNVSVTIQDEKYEAEEEISNISYSNFYGYDENEEDYMVVSIDYNDRSNTEKAYITQAYYGDLINKYSKMYGMDPNLVLAIATQERGIHGTTIDVGGAIGLMQIQYNVWAGQKISAYNFQTGKRESFIID